MSIPTQEILQLKELLRSYFVESLPPELLPVPGGRFSLDSLLENGASMSLQTTGGTTKRTYIDETAVRELHFTVFYRSQDAVNNNKAKSTMMGVLDGIGIWMEEAPMPYLGDWLRVGKLQLVQPANILDQTEQHVTYQAGYMLGYTTR